MTENNKKVDFHIISTNDACGAELDDRPTKMTVKKFFHRLINNKLLHHTSSDLELT